MLSLAEHMAGGASSDGQTELSSDKWHAASTDEVGGAGAWGGDEEYYDVGRRALVCLHRQAASIHHSVWGAAPPLVESDVCPV